MKKKDKTETGRNIYHVELSDNTSLFCIAKNFKNALKASQRKVKEINNKKNSQEYLPKVEYGQPIEIDNIGIASNQRYVIEAD